MSKLNSKDLTNILEVIKDLMIKNKEYLIKLDSQNGDGDLGLSMESGFTSIVTEMREYEEEDLGQYMFKVSKVLNESAPSSLGTLLSIYFMGMARYLKGKKEISLEEFILSLDAGLDNMMKKGGAKPGEKTIIDSLYPGIESMKADVYKDISVRDLFMEAFNESEKGMLATRSMRSVHGRAAYYGDDSIGVLDGGAAVGMYIIEGISKYMCENFG